MTIPFAAYWELTKPRVVALIVFTAVIGMFLAIRPGEDWPWERIVLGAIGIWLAAASAAAINHLLDQRIDVLMARTQHRPLAVGSLRPSQVLAFALLLGALSMGLLTWRVNGFTAALTFASLIGYAIIYTGWLKRATPQNIVIGGRAGAAPPLLGWAAVKGWPAGVSFFGLAGAPLHYDHALLLVLIIYVWTPPHFWALAIFRRDDYAKALIPMLPVVYGVTYTRWQILFYTVLLLAVTVLPFVAGMSGVFYLGGALVLGGVFLYYAIKLLNPPNELYAMKVFNYSIVYLMALFAFLLADHWLLRDVAMAAQTLEFVPA
ncbi:MAG: heme o synthase [Arenimonas sp.]|uniref:heme o synthase n=1 Tax=Arenimonas sp. TaxID=1872635 RepID=UPI0025C0DFD9|nr:heme o synthase [Arenimonas sp.]MBW8366238.1 heme o synthase [Arenimonas sp.]